MRFNRFFFCISISVLNLACAVITQAQQSTTSEPDAPATVARPSTPAPPASGVPHEIKFSAILKDSTGKPLTGTVAVTFALYDQQDGGTPSWSETQNMEVDAQGRYTVLLGAASSAGLPAELFGSSDGRWLGVRVLAPGNAELPRVRWVSVPYALKAADAETLGGRPLSSFLMAPEAQSGANPVTAAPSAANSPLASTVTGTGAAGFIAKFTTATTLGDSVIFEKTGNIGLGTTSPISKLSVVGNITATGSIAAGGILSLPKTTSTAVGVLNVGGVRFLHSFGGFNTFVGAAAGNMTMTGSDNTAVGNSALSSNTTGHNNASFGPSALGSNTTGFSNSAFGSGTLFANSTGSRNSAFGDGSLLFNTTGTDNSAFGFNALLHNSTGLSNAGFGSGALNANTTGSFNAAFGMFALAFNTGGEHNTAMGYQALYSRTSGAFNVAVGERALLNLTSGDANIAIGSGVGHNLTSGTQNIYLGSIQTASSESYTIRIGDVISQTAIFIAGIAGQTIASGTAVFINNAGQLGTITSSQRYKNDISDMDAESDLLMKLRPVAFYYKPELDDTHTRQYGLVAEEVAKIAPQLVAFDKDGAPQTVRYHFVNAMLLNEVQKQRQLLEEQRQASDKQQGTIKDLNARLAKLEALLAIGQ